MKGYTYTHTKEIKNNDKNIYVERVSKNGGDFRMYLNLSDHWLEIDAINIARYICKGHGNHKSKLYRRLCKKYRERNPSTTPQKVIHRQEKLENKEDTETCINNQKTITKMSITTYL